MDKIVHEGVRLRILTYLTASEKPGVSFNELQESLGLTSGNLSVQLKKLNTAGYVEIQKSFRRNKPHTRIQMTKAGLDALKAYVAEMESLLSGLKF